jgi:CheY-like chemotaxis protein
VFVAFYDWRNKEVIMAHILIVDDQPSVRQLLTAQLTLDGHHVTTMGDSGFVP